LPARGKSERVECAACRTRFNIPIDE
jgi:hypothetical protein